MNKLKLKEGVSLKDVADCIKDSKLQVYEDFSLREKVMIKLIVFLIEFIGKKEDGFYGHNLDSCVHDIFFSKD